MSKVVPVEMRFVPVIIEVQEMIKNKIKLNPIKQFHRTELLVNSHLLKNIFI